MRGDGLARGAQPALCRRPHPHRLRLLYHLRRLPRRRPPVPPAPATPTILLVLYLISHILLLFLPIILTA